MKRIKAVIVAIFMVMTVSPISAMDVYDWRARTEGLCSGNTFKLLPIRTFMAGGRPEHLVVEKMADAIPVLQELYEIDEKTAQIIIKSYVQSYFSDARMRNPLNLSVESYKKVFSKCSAAILKHDPDGRKAELYLTQKREADEKKEKKDAMEQAEQEEAARKE